MLKKSKLSPLEKSWILYDMGDSGFVMLVSTLIPIYFSALASSAGVSEDLYLSIWGYAGSIATALVGLLSPIFGTLADQKNFKKPMFLICLSVGLLGCACMGFTGSWIVFLGIFIVSKLGLSSSVVFYDSMLPEISTEKRMDSVSSLGYAIGYIGSTIPFTVCLCLVLFADAIGISQPTAMMIAFLITALWWGGCACPLIRRYQQTAFVPRRAHPVRDSFRQLANTFRSARKQPHIFLYLLAFFFFINGVYTIIDMATAYGTALGLKSEGLLLALLVTQLVAFPCAIFFGHLANRFPSGRLIKICILCYTGITVFAMFLVAQWQFWVLAVLVGMFQGGIQALSRSYLGKIIPPEQCGEYYGLMDICGKGAGFLGMALVGVVSQLTIGKSFPLFGVTLQNENIAVGALVVLFIIGFILFCKADRMNRKYNP